MQNYVGDKQILYIKYSAAMRLWSKPSLNTVNELVIPGCYQD